jgi:hypothetical protein
MLPAGALYGAERTRANYSASAFNLFGFCSRAEKHKWVKLGIAKTVLSKPQKGKEEKNKNSSR